MPTSSGNAHSSSSGHSGNAQSSGSIGSSSSGHTGVAGGSSIPFPALQNRFLVRVESTPKSFNEQCVAFAMNMVAKEIIMVVEQSTTNPTREHVVIQDIISSPKRVVTLDIVDGNHVPIDTIKFRDCSIIQHNVEFSYDSSGAVIHIVTFSYVSIDLTSGGKSHAAFNSAMSIVGKP